MRLRRTVLQRLPALTQMAIRELKSGNAAKARELLERALVFPHNLGEGKLEGAKDNNIHYFLGLAEKALGNEAESIRHLELAAAGNEEPASAMYYNDQPADMILYQGLANRALGREDRARSRFYKLISYGEKHYYDRVKMDSFAVSLPDLLIWDGNLDEQNRIHCLYMLALGYYGLGDKMHAEHYLTEVENLDINHFGAHALR